MLIATVHGADDSDNELADDHTKCSPQKERTAAKLLNCVERDGGRADVDDSGNHADEEGVIDGSQL